MLRAIAVLRALWIVLMAVLLVLVGTGSIGGYGMAAYGAVVLAVMFTEQALRRRVKT